MHIKKQAKKPDCCRDQAGEPLNSRHFLFEGIKVAHSLQATMQEVRNGLKADCRTAPKPSLTLQTYNVNESQRTTLLEGESPPHWATKQNSIGWHNRRQILGHGCRVQHFCFGVIGAKRQANGT